MESMKFKRRLQEIQAVQWHKMGDHPNVYPAVTPTLGRLKIHHQESLVNPGDWIVEYEGGHMEVWGNNIFQKAFEEMK